MEKKRHHFVPVTYLSSFCDKDGWLFCYRKKGTCTPYPSRPEKTGFQKYYYSQKRPDGTSENNLLEDLFSTECEAKWPKIIKQFQKRSVPKSSIGDIYAFIGLQFARVPAQRNAFEAHAANYIKNLSIQLEVQGKIPPLPSVDGIEDINEHVEVKFDQQYLLRGMVELMEYAGTIMTQIGFSVLHNKTSIPFITSDNPVIWFDPTLPNALRLPYKINRSGNIRFLFPVSKKLLIYGDTSLGKHFGYHGFKHPDINSTKKIEDINKEICQFAYNAIFASNDNLTPLVEKHKDTSPIILKKISKKDFEEPPTFEYTWGKP